MTGLLVAVEGPKSVGKTTLITRLRGTPSGTGDWVFTKEPTDAFDLGNEQQHAGVELAALIAEDRAQHVATVIQPALDRGLVVVTDRYVLSSFVFHCLDEVSEQAVADLNAQFPHPDILLVLQCSPSALADRRAKREVQTRLSSTIPPAADTLGYVTYANHCRPVSGEIMLGYNETMEDCSAIAERLITTVRAKRNADG